MKELLNTIREALTGLEEGLRHKAGSGTAAKGGAKGARSRKAAKRGGGGRVASGRPGAALSQKAAKKTAAKAAKKTAAKAAKKAAAKKSVKLTAIKATKKAAKKATTKSAAKTVAAKKAAKKATKKATKKGAKRPLPLPRNASASVSQAPRRGFLTRRAQKGTKQRATKQERANVRAAMIETALVRSDQFDNARAARREFIRKGRNIPVLTNRVQFATGRRSFASGLNPSVQSFFVPNTLADAQRLMRAGYTMAGTGSMTRAEQLNFRRLYTAAQQRRFSR